MNFSQRISRLHSRNTIISVLSDTALYGEPNRSSFQAVHQTLKRLEIYEALQLNSLFCVVKKLEETLLHWRPYKFDVLQVLSDLNHEVNELSKREFDHDKTCRNLETAKWARDVTLKHIIEILQRFIASYTLLPKKAARNHETNEILELKGIALEILHNICVEFEEQAQHCAENENFLKSLFSYMQYDQTCFPACRVLECLMLARKNVFDLSTVENLQDIITGLDDAHLGNFCKILAITLSELDMYENKTSLYAQTKQKKNQNFYVRDINQDVILRTPKILSRLVDVACAKPYVPWSDAAASSLAESEQWLKWIDDRCNEDNAADDYENDPFIGGITTWSECSNYGPPKTAIKITLELTFRADAVCVLGLLLVGRHRKEVQKELAELKLIPQLSDLFDHFLWRTNVREYTRLPGHNSSCECSPEVALKIQVLRLIHSFCDHSDYKHVMLSWSEYSEITAIEERSEADFPTWLRPSAMCIGNNGLLSKIVEVIKKETGASTFRFWLSRAIESYLRGSFSSADQDFLLRRNLMQHVIQNLITSNIRHKEVLQSSFDLLGELVKFNVTAFIDLNTLLHNSPRQQRKLLTLMNSSLVDSNMFIRSLILSYELFVSSGDEDMKAFAEECCSVLCHVGSLKTRINYLQRLLSLINIHNLTQVIENVSCLNTALVILMFGLKKGELPQYLHFLASSVADGCSVATSTCALHLENLRDLLLFWQDHYLQKDKDCTILEKGSRICFQEWRETVSLLTCDDCKNPCAIAFYTTTAVSSRAS
ncbi:short transient receptor potential channel 4-associated protein-like isoform X2 [Argiope bruennichi]|uniref:short transient receptor potential channel 4-associated protein-like isoform X2 n=1 Tax=Argiope bruennichi TaxID=94029 RepID=UPI0024951B60|nr:short transient receptor potential channel 4-associated protein-like isoform X2 [Argiope bruennichi]